MHCRSTTSRSGFPSRVRSSTAASAAGRESSTSFHRASNNDGSSGCSLAVLNTPSGPTLLTWTCATAHRDRRWSSSQKRRRITRDTRCGRPGRLMVRAFFQVGRRRAACLTRRRKAVSLPRMSRHPSGNREPNGSRLSSAVEQRPGCGPTRIHGVPRRHPHVPRRLRPCSRRSVRPLGAMQVPDGWDPSRRRAVVRGSPERLGAWPGN